MGIELSELADLRALIEREVRRQLGLLESPSAGPRVLVIWGGAPNGREEGQAQVAALQRKGVVVRSLSASGLADGYSGDGQHSPLDDGVGPGDPLAESDAVLVPALGWVEAAKLALGLADTPPLQMVFAALAAGLPVIIGRDGCLPSLPTLAGAGRAGARSAMAQMFDAYLQRLESFGARLVPAASLASEVMAALAPTPVSPSVPTQGPKQIVTGEDVLRAMETDHRIVVPKGSIVTALAADLAKAKGVAIEFAP